MRIMDSQREKYIAATKELVETLSRSFENTNKRLSQMGEASQLTAMIAQGKGLGNMTYPIWDGYWKWMNDVGATTRKEVEELQKSFGDDKDVLKCTEELRAVEDKFGEMGTKVNAVLQKEEDKVANGMAQAYSQSDR